MEPVRYIDNLVPKAGRFPYYIVVPRYVRTSAGIRALHILCHWLNMTGHSAYLIISPYWDGLQINPELTTPLLDKAIVDYHFEKGATPIVIYPEVLAGNPFNAPIIVRWVGNYPGLLGGAPEFGDEEICFSFSQALADHTKNPKNVITVPVLDTNVFKPTPVVPRKGTCFYAAKYKAVYGGTVFGLPDGCYEITRDTPDQLSPPEIADLFRRSELFYCFEDSALINEAALCGCPVVMVPNDFFKWPLAIDEVGWDGYAWGDSPEEVDRARRTVSFAYDNYVRNIPNFFRQLEYLVAVTQRRAAVTPYVSPVVLNASVNLSGRDQVSSLRAALSKALMDIETLQGAAPGKQLLWTSALQKSGDDRTVKFISGFGVNENGAVWANETRSMFVLLPPSDAAVVDLTLLGRAMPRGSTSIDVLIDGEPLISVKLDNAEEKVVSVPLTDPGRPVICSLVAVPDTTATGTRPETRQGNKIFGLKNVCLRLRRDESTSTPAVHTATTAASQVPAHMAALSEPLRIDLTTRDVRVTHNQGCHFVFGDNGLTVRCEGLDPNVLVNLARKIGAQSHSIYLWGVYQSAQVDTLQVFTPLPSNDFIESISVKIDVQPGTHAFCVTLPFDNEFNFIRIDPLSNTGTIVFKHFEIVVYENEKQFGLTAGDQNGGKEPNLRRFDRLSLIKDFRASGAVDCDVGFRASGIVLTPTGNAPRIVFSRDQDSAVVDGKSAFIYVKYRSDAASSLSISVPGLATNSVSSAMAVGIDIHRGTHSACRPLTGVGDVREVALSIGRQMARFELIEAEVLLVDGEVTMAALGLTE